MDLMSLYGPGSLFEKEPVAIKAALIAVAAAVIITWPELDVSGEAVAAWGIAAELVLGLFVRSKSTSNASAEAMVASATAETEVRVKSDVDEYLSAMSVDSENRAVDEANLRLSEGLAAAEAEIRALKAAPVKKAPAKKAVKKK